MRKRQLHAEFEFDFELYGIVSTEKDYKLAWSLNNVLDISLVRQEDVRITFVDYELIIGNYTFSRENASWRLLRNKSYDTGTGESQFLVPEMSRMDYFITAEGDSAIAELTTKTDDVRSIRGVEYITKIEVEKLKSKENFIY